MTRRPALGLAIAAASGLLFGIGLLASGMTEPLKVKGFLDVAGLFAGTWDPSLAFVMGGAVAVASIGFARAARRRFAWSGAPMQLPAGRRIGARLIGGGLLFGAGWGLAGYCPGPALVALAGLGEGAPAAAWFVAAMLAGMWGHDAAAAAFARHAATAAPARQAEAAALRRKVAPALPTPADEPSARP